MCPNVPARVPVSVWDTFWSKKIDCFFGDMRLLRTLSVFRCFFELFFRSKNCHPRVPVNVWHDFSMDSAETLTGTHGSNAHRQNPHRLARGRSVKQV